MSTYTPIASVTLSSAQSSVTFSGIPQTYTDLVVVINGYLDNNDAYTPGFTFNGDSGSNYSQTNLTGTGSIAKSSRFTNNTIIVLGSNDLGWSTTAGNRNVTVLQVMNYANTTTNKTTICRSNQTSGSYPATEAEVGLWRSTSAITSINISGRGANFASTTTFNLYGVANASITNVAKATGGDSVYTDGTYWYHIFRSSGTFTPTQAISCDYLVVAGGGGGSSGGGGGGGFRTATSQALTAQGYAVTIGAGGAGGSNMASNGTKGSNSSFNSTSSTGGGYGAYAGGTRTGGPGGSGGGGAKDAGSTSSFGAGNEGGYSPSEGNNGGYVSGAYPPTGWGAAGGGGAGATGGNGASSEVAGNGGAGASSSLSGTSVTYAGGGGGASNGGTAGTGGSGGGGNGGNATTGSAGVANTGGGGGGGYNDPTQVQGAGGSGIVIVRYSAA